MTLDRLTSCLPLAALLWLALPGETLAQVDTTRTALPDIAPREVEIRGQLEISLPSLRRQPLVGFNPPPRVPRPPAGRRPFAETYKQASADLPASPLRRPLPPSALSAAALPAEGLVETSVGRYFSRSAYARIQAPLTNQASFMLRADYRGSDGHEPFDETPDLNAPFDTFEGLIGVQRAGSQWAAGFTFSGFYESYDLFGLQDIPRPDPSLLLRSLEREGRGVVGALQLTTLTGTAIDARLDLSYGATRYETQVRSVDNVPEPGPELSEQRFEADADVHFPVQTGDAWISGSVSAASLADGLGTYSAFEGGGGLRFQLDRAMTLRVGARFLGGFSDTATPRGSSDEVQIGYLSPDLHLEFLPTTGVRLYARNRPGVEPNAVADVYRVNPYLNEQVEFRPTLRTVDAELGGSVFAGPVQMAAKAGFQDMPQVLYFEHAGGTTSRGSTALRYGEADVAYAGGSISAVLPGGLHAMVGATYRDGRLSDEDVEIPYFAPVLGEATLSYAFAQRRGLIQLTGHYESARYIDRQQSRKAGAYLDLDVETTFNVTPLLGVVLRVENISGSNNTRWDNYPESTLLIGAGLRVKW